MKLIVCVDDKFGMLFGGRRQSKDCALRENMLELTQNSLLWMNAYTAAQFEDKADNIRIDEACLEKVGAEEYCFAENSDIVPYADRVRCVILYHWNRTYPSDSRFPIELFADRWHLESVTEFSGTSHETITREVYVL